MSKTFWKSLLVCPALLSAALVASTQAIAAEVNAPEATPTSNATLNQIQQYGNKNAISQVTSVSQLSDVQPTDWAFQALQSLVERYGVIAGYPDGKFRGNRAMTRYEFAAGLNAALDRVNELIAAGTADLVSKEDLATLQKLQEEFSAELATLRGRVDALEARTATLEAQQFSTTTKLVGEAIFGVTDVFSGDDPSRPTNADAAPRQNTVLGHRVRLNLNTSFTGKDLLSTRLQVGNLAALTTPGGSFEGAQTFNVGASSNTFNLDTLTYQFPLGNRTRVVVSANAGDHSDVVPTLNPYFEDFDGGNGSLSAFGQRSPIYRIGSGTGAGVGFHTQLSNALSFSGSYLSSTANDPTDGTGGVFNGSYSAIGQLTFNPGGNLSLALTYSNAYFTAATGSLFGGTSGTSLTNLSLAGATRAIANSYGVEASFRFSPGLVLNGWAMTTKGRTLNSGVGDFDLWSYAVGLAFPDLGKKGNVLGLLVGVQPYLTGVNNSGAGFNRDTPFHVEGFYKYQLNDNISITPGVIWLTAPNQNNNNPDVVIGTLRTTFTF